MSNFEASKLYEQVIEEVISDSRQDFEDSGIDESTLQELRKIWCQKLSQSSVAKFSWDDEANREDELQAPLHQQDHLAQDSTLEQREVQVPSAGSDLHHLDDEGSNGLELPNTTLSYNTHVVSSSNNDTGLQLPGMDSNVTKSEDDGGLMIPRIGQSDGTIEFTMYSDDAERLMKKLKRKELKTKRQNSQQNGDPSVAQVDGADDFDDDDVYNDSDDINSDLDDDVESDKEDDEDGQDEGQIMLCLYDKVQRVKNKWKSTLKEGVANINGRDYVFQKANGESEW